MAGFVQIVALKTSRIDEIRKLVADVRSELGAEASLRETVTADLDRPGHYLHLIEFESAELATKTRPTMSRFASRVAELCAEPPRVSNLEVIQTWQRESSRQPITTVVAEAATVAGIAATVDAASNGADGKRPDTDSEGLRSQSPLEAGPDGHGEPPMSSAANPRLQVRGYVDGVPYRLDLEIGSDNDDDGIVTRCEPRNALDLVRQHIGEEVGLTVNGPFVAISLTDPTGLVAGLGFYTDVVAVEGDLPH